ncbi:hypothetical protein OG271_18510 [Micromonospora rifamycinica]|uniref:hypothetical protein n=1 Tax=Micromonospora rifamycinica TaxID=291594 RepID=UPI002E293908|nr:hypothetical protein [Micromonospora rifamycinica]
MVDHAVLLVTRQRDAELSRIGSWLSRVGVPTCRLDSDRLDGVTVQVDPDARTVRVGGRRFVPTVTWIRHFAMRGSTGHGDPGRLMLYRDSWRALTAQLGVVSELVVGDRAPGRLEQHAQAVALGIRVPRTLVTTDPASVTSTFEAARYVVKAVHRHFVEPEPGRFTWFHPFVVDAHRLRGANPLAPAPVLVEEFVPHQQELRVYLIGGQVYGYRVSKRSPDDPWLRPGTVRVSAVAVPAPVAAAARTLGDFWDLPYAAFDFLVDHSGEPVLLELDPHGDWCWFERMAGDDRVGAAAVRMVCDAHRRSRPVEAPSLLAFLGAAGPTIIRNSRSTDASATPGSED